MRSSEPEVEAWHVPLGRVEYRHALAIQQRIHDGRRQGRLPDVLLTLEHDPPVLTRGRSSGDRGLIASLDEIRRAGIEIHDVERGGDITYHGPGQLVAYPIVDLRRLGKDIHAHVDRLEEAAIRTLARFGIRAVRRPGYPGVWVKEGKIASIGVYVRDWTTRHGLALNVDVSRDHFAMIRPCGLPVRAVSMVELIEDGWTISQVEGAFAQELADLLGWKLMARRRDEMGAWLDGE